MNAAEQKGAFWAKHYQYHINLCQHFKCKPHAMVPISNPPPKSWSCKAIEAERTLDSIQALFQIDYKQSILNIKLKLV